MSQALEEIIQKRERKELKSTDDFRRELGLYEFPNTLRQNASFAANTFWDAIDEIIRLREVIAMRREDE